jgi:8-oxo-dGTP pyrophosphatase MutT (NUDIX family)
MHSADPIPSATVVVLRERDSRLEVLMLRRSAAVSVHGGGWVFPGGRLEAGDATDSDILGGLRRAAVRETCEEAGVVLDEGLLVPWSRWITPVFIKPRFDTLFFAAAVPAEVPVTVDGREIDAHAWLSPRAAVEKRDRKSVV